MPRVHLGYQLKEGHVSYTPQNITGTDPTGAQQAAANFSCKCPNFGILTLLSPLANEGHEARIYFCVMRL